MQKLTIIGNLTKEPELRTTQSGKSVCSFTVAVNRRFPVDGEKVTDFFRITSWGQMGEACAKYLDKGKKVSVIGELQPRLYETTDGTTRMSLDVSADEVEFLTPKGAGQSDNPASSPIPEGFEALDEDELPF